MGGGLDELGKTTQWPYWAVYFPTALTPIMLLGHEEGMVVDRIVSWENHLKEKDLTDRRRWKQKIKTILKRRNNFKTNEY